MFDDVMDKKPTVAELYGQAVASTNLKVDVNRTGAVDVLVASAWCGSRVGMALLRLRTEFDSTSLRMGKPGASLVVAGLRSYPGVLEQVRLQAVALGFSEPVELARAVLVHWLSGVCGGCDGLRFKRAAGAPALSCAVCRACSGTGFKRLPHGEFGAKIERYLLECVERAQASIKKRLRPV